MALIKEENFNRIVKNQENYVFDIIESGLYLVSISAKCKNWLQNFRKLFNDDDLAIEIDGFPFFEYKGKRKEFNSPASWNGNELKDLSKTNFYIIPFYFGKHNIRFFTDQSPFLGNIKIFKLEIDSSKTINITDNFLSGTINSELFLDIAIKNIDINSVKILASAETNDKLGIKFDGLIIENEKSKKNKIWYWLGSQLKGKDKELTKEVDSNSNLRYLELKKIANPIVKNIEFFIGDFTLNKTGKIAIYSDIEISDFVNLRKNPDDKSDLICKINNREKIEILEEVVLGSYIDYRSYVWHKIKYKNQEGFILSSYIEIDGQGRDRIIEIIKSKAKEVGIDENLVLSLAGCESRYKVYASGGEAVKDNVGRGVFQITEDLKKDLNDPKNPFYSPIENLFDADKNITAGVKYFNWLYNLRYKNCKDKLVKSVAGYNFGPYNIPVDKKFDLNLYSKETKRSVNCVIENNKKKKWFNIFWPILALVFVIFNFGFLYLNYTGKSQGKDYFLANVSNFNGESVTNGKKIAESNSKAYFSVTNYGYCGSLGCTQVIYEFDLQSKVSRKLKDNIFGDTPKMIISPDKLKAVLVYSVATGSGCGNSYINLIDLASFSSEELKVIESRNFSDNHAKSVLWKNSNEIEVVMNYWNCGNLYEIKQEKLLKYNLETNKLINIVI